MIFEFRKANHSSLIPSNSEIPLSGSMLSEAFEVILPEDKLIITSEWFENTSDILLCSSSFGTLETVHTWTMRQIAVDKASVDHVRELLSTEGLERIQNWFFQTRSLIFEDPGLWRSYQFTVCFESEELIYKERRAERAARRPLPGWPKEPYQPS
jgi:hypothetical protein